MGKKNKKGMEKCSCQCHTFAKCCHGFGIGDKNCCDSPHVVRTEWKTRIDSQKKSKILEQLRMEAKK